MKRIFWALGITLIIGSCGKISDGYTITGTISGDLENGTQVFLRKTDENNQPVDVDTTDVQDGKFVFTGKAEMPELQYIFVDKLPGYTAVVVENGEIVFSANKDSLGLAIIKGTEQNDIFADYIGKSQAISKRALSIQQDMQRANTERNEASIAALREEMNELQEEYKSFELDYVKDNPNGLISALLIDRALASRVVPAAKIRELYDGLTPKIKETKVGKEVLERLVEFEKKEEQSKSTEVGALAPNFSAPDPNGKLLALNDVKGKLTLVDFWAAWCRPCRAENPNLVRVYEKYHDKGLSIIGVSLDKKAEDWKKAIEDDGLNWNHVSNIAYFDDAIAKLYNVDAIPAAFLLDENGVIVAKNLRGPALETKVAELLQ
ncbi:MAG: AhpC/TSA family protein [Flavobacteriales bacterium]|nr:MAG: AhpC/TSA family protein [Flavobacteriales bacterium]